MATAPTQVLVVEFINGKNVFRLNVPEDLAVFLEQFATTEDDWLRILETGAHAMIPLVDHQRKSAWARKWEGTTSLPWPGPGNIQDPRRDPLEQVHPTHIQASHVHLDATIDPLDVGLNQVMHLVAQRLSSLEDAAKVNPGSEVAAAPPRTDQRSLNADRLVRAYGVLSDKDVRVKLTCEGRRPSDAQEIYIDLPAEKV